MPAPMRPEAAGLLVDGNVEAGLPQRCRHSQAAHAGADDGDLKFLIGHSCPSSFEFVLRFPSPFIPAKTGIQH